MPGCRAMVAESDREQFKQGICSGVVRGVAFMDLDMCAPGEVTQGQVLRVVVRYIDERPARQLENFVKLAAEALRAAWPCR